MKYIIIYFLLKSTGAGQLDKYLEQNSKVFYNRDSAFVFYNKVKDKKAIIDSVRLKRYINSLLFKTTKP